MLKERYSREEFLMMFREDVIRLSRYIPWFEEKCGDDVSKNYQDGDLMNHTLQFPVYDSILLAFLNDASTTVFMEQNYHYFYSRNRIKSYEDELRLIEAADIMHMDVLQCILSRYVFGGMTKAYLWKDGVEHRIFVSVLKKARQIIEFWSQPLIIEDEISPDGEVMNVEPVEVEPVAVESVMSDDEFFAQIMAEYEAEDAAAVAAEASTGDEGALAQESVTEEAAPEQATMSDDEFFAQIMAEYEAEDAAAAAAEETEIVEEESESEAEIVETDAVEEVNDEVMEDDLSEMTEDETTKDATEDAMAEDAMTEDAMAEDAMTEDAMVEDEMTEEDAVEEAEETVEETEESEEEEEVAVIEDAPIEDAPIEDDIMDEMDELTVEEEIVSE